jgi:Flp pilus assembly protein TadD
VTLETIERARGLEELAADLQRSGRYREAEEPLQQAIEIWKLLRNDLEVWNDERCLAISYRRRGDVNLALPILERLVDGFAGAYALPEVPYHHRLALNDLAISYLAIGRTKEARATLTLCLGILDGEIAGAERTRDHFRTERARVLENLSYVMSEDGDRAAAEAYAEHARAEWSGVEVAD